MLSACASHSAPKRGSFEPEQELPTHATGGREGIILTGFTPVEWDHQLHSTWQAGDRRKSVNSNQSSVTKRSEKARKGKSWNTELSNCGIKGKPGIQEAAREQRTDPLNLRGQSLGRLSPASG
jgi:hypothetical protein